MSNGLKMLLFVIISSFLIGCKTTETVSTAKAKKRSVKFLLRKLEQNHIDYTWFASRAKVKMDSEQQKATFSTLIRMQKDSLIWIKIKKMNIEGARVKITPQTIEILDRQESQYIKKPFSYLKNEFGLQLNFAELQELIVGNPILFQEETLLSVIREQQNVLKTPESEKNVLKLFMNPQSFLVNELRGSMDYNSIDIKYEDYQTIEQTQIPAVKNIEIDSKDAGIVQLKMTFSKMVLNEVQKVGFTVPDSYQRN
ncbi:DUF4292 domain-containing protein [Aureispira anguillae]|uniref:DUF4292 domain-containing protein n=1 Tax=Aureispira anguillae TaxID=2864201 RepID=A0A915YKB8_9BACT|nr:DUF4292 domain-containing protein [Aureispira anguillae]BDS14788.1 DUF4292 domain-containing protein [Aureispira anguillae]